MTSIRAFTVRTWTHWAGYWRLKAGDVVPSSLTISTVLGLLVPPIRSVPSSTVQLMCLALGWRRRWVSTQVPSVRVRQEVLDSSVSPPQTVRPELE